MKPEVELQDGININQNILPDFIVTRNGDSIEVCLYRQRSESLNINSSWKEMAENNAKVTTDKSAVQYIKNKLQSAQKKKQTEQQRETTMLKIMKAIVQMQ